MALSDLAPLAVSRRYPKTLLGVGVAAFLAAGLYPGPGKKADEYAAWMRAHYTCVRPEQRLHITKFHFFFDAANVTCLTPDPGRMKAGMMDYSGSWGSRDSLRKDGQPLPPSQFRWTERYDYNPVEPAPR